jgi:hypothetical protein
MCPACGNRRVTVVFKSPSNAMVGVGESCASQCVRSYITEGKKRGLLALFLIITIDAPQRANMIVCFLMIFSTCFMKKLTNVTRIIIRFVLWQNMDPEVMSDLFPHLLRQSQ